MSSWSRWLREATSLTQRGVTWVGSPGCKVSLGIRERSGGGGEVQRRWLLVGQD